MLVVYFLLSVVLFHLIIAVSETAVLHLRANSVYYAFVNRLVVPFICPFIQSDIVATICNEQSEQI